MPFIPSVLEAQTANGFTVVGKAISGPRGLWHGAYGSALSPVVHWLMAMVAALVAVLSETKRFCHKGKRWVEKWKNKGHCQGQNGGQRAHQILS